LGHAIAKPRRMVSRAGRRSLCLLVSPYSHAPCSTGILCYHIFMRPASYLLIAGLASACDKAEEVPCSDLDEVFYDAQINDMHDVDFQMRLNDRLVQANLDDELQAEDLADVGNDLELACASSITVGGQPALAATNTKKGVIYVDIDEPGYTENRSDFSEYLNDGDPYAYLDGVGDQLPSTAHEFVHNLFPDVHHSDETQALIASIPSDDDMSPCEGWTYVANETDDLIYDVHAHLACAYEDFEAQKLEDL
jgi:hypothetical protein